MLTLVISAYGRWKLSIGEPTIADWVMTAMYIATALLCWAYARYPETLRGHRAFWRSLAVSLLVLGINKQLDLHVLLEAICREVAKRHGWYPQRRTIQMWFVMGLTSASLALVIFTGFVVRRALRQRLLTFCGIVLLYPSRKRIRCYARMIWKFSAKRLRKAFACSLTSSKNV